MARLMIYVNSDLIYKVQKFRECSARRNVCESGRELKRALEDEDRAAFELADLVSRLLTACEEGVS
ncbi:hypothetical protein TERTU_1428 [Teredinibacter turnerae T7901]|uniref:Uncharacterized protein n=1 Tax=Teredinibacter turnerae (strain ATCC 39867 / T7901) TaxID=377629 RepID=C5BSN1_TERTT|nr:hypothetical protein TERTU_1428 [Teredinibacter turnerae T7901]